MFRLAFATKKELNELRKELIKRERISIIVTLPETCYEKETVLTIKKSKILGYQLFAKESFCFSDNKKLNILMNYGFLFFFSFNDLVKFFRSLQASFPKLYKKKHKKIPA